MKDDFIGEVKKEAKGSLKRRIFTYILIFIILAAGAFGAGIGINKFLSDRQKGEEQVAGNKYIAPKIKKTEPDKKDTTQNKSEETSKNTQNEVNIPTFPNYKPTPYKYTPAYEPPKTSQHIITFYYKKHTCYNSMNGNRDYEIVDYAFEGGIRWDAHYNDITLCSIKTYTLYSISRSSLYDSKSIDFDIWHFPPNYATDVDGDTILIRYDINKTRIESITYSGT